MDPAPSLPQDALDLLAIGRRYYDVVVEWVPRGDERCYGRAFGFWSVRAGPPGWEAQHRETERLAVPAPPPPGKAPPPVTCQWVDARETIRKALTMARERWPECCHNGPTHGDRRATGD